MVQHKSLVGVRAVVQLSGLKRNRTWLREEANVDPTVIFFQFLHKSKKLLYRTGFFPLFIFWNNCFSHCTLTSPSFFIHLFLLLLYSLLFLYLFTMYDAHLFQCLFVPTFDVGCLWTIACMFRTIKSWGLTRSSKCDKSIDEVMNLYRLKWFGYV